MASTKKTPAWAAKLVEPFRASPRKSGFLAALAILLVAMWVKMFGGGHGPSAALAAPAPAGTTFSRTFDSLPMAPVHRADADVNSLQHWSRQAIIPVKRNFFCASMDRFPLEDTRHIDPVMVGEGFWDRLAKSMAAQADQEEQRQVLVSNLRTKAAELNLQSTIMGSQPRAMVNGDMVREGSVVAGFRVLKIEARKMVVEREGIKLEIIMN
jgi:hypothetical protein